MTVYRVRKNARDIPGVPPYLEPRNPRHASSMIAFVPAMRRHECKEVELIDSILAEIKDAEENDWSIEQYGNIESLAKELKRLHKGRFACKKP